MNTHFDSTWENVENEVPNIAIIPLTIESTNRLDKKVDPGDRDRRFWVKARREIFDSNADNKKREWKLGITKKWYTYVRAYGSGRWSQEATRLYRGQGVGPMMELKIADDQGRLPRLERAIRKPKVIPVAEPDFEPTPYLPEAIVKKDEPWVPVRMDGTKGVNVWIAALLVMVGILILIFVTCFILKKRLSCKGCLNTIKEKMGQKGIDNRQQQRKSSVKGNFDSPVKRRVSQKGRNNAVGPPRRDSQTTSFDAI